MTKISTRDQASGLTKVSIIEFGGQTLTTWGHAKLAQANNALYRVKNYSGPATVTWLLRSNPRQDGGTVVKTYSMLAGSAIMNDAANAEAPK